MGRAGGTSQAGSGRAFAGIPDGPRGWRRHLPPLVLCLLLLSALLPAAKRHVIGGWTTETDFYAAYAPDASRLSRGEFPVNPFQGPGYPAAVAVGTLVTGDAFRAGVWISVLAALAVGWLAFRLHAGLFGYWTGASAALLTVASGALPRFSISAGTDLFFLMLCLGSLASLLETGWPGSVRVTVSGAFAGAALLTRYNGLFLPAACVAGIFCFGLFAGGVARRMRLAGLFLLVFLTVASPWLWANARHRGSPLYNENYLNMATLFYPELAGDRADTDGTTAARRHFGSLGDVLSRDPARMARALPGHLRRNLLRSLNGDLTGPLLGWLAAAGGLLILTVGRTGPRLFVLFTAAGFFLLTGLTHWEARYYFFILAIYAGLGAHAVLWLSRVIAGRLGISGARRAVLPALVIGCLGLAAALDAAKDVGAFLKAQPMEVLRARDFLETNGVQGTRIVARKPHLPFVSGREWVFFPPVRSLEALRRWLLENRVDYVAVGSIEVRRRPGIAPLRDPRRAPPWLEPVWESKAPLLILYRPALDRG